MKYRIFVLILLCFIMGCTARSSQALLDRHQIQNPKIDELSVCISYGCRHLLSTYLTDREWDMVVQSMMPGHEDSSFEERQRISETIGLLERIIGPKVGTQYNRARNESGPRGTRQLDCIAETVNTTVYLKLLEENSLMHYHRLVEPARKGPLSSGTWLHFTSVIEELDTGERFAVDPWFFDNGHPAVIISLQRWMLPNREVNLSP